MTLLEYRLYLGKPQNFSGKLYRPVRDEYHDEPQNSIGQALLAGFELLCVSGTGHEPKSGTDNNQKKGKSGKSKDERDGFIDNISNRRKRESLVFSRVVDWNRSLVRPRKLDGLC